MMIPWLGMHVHENAIASNGQDRILRPFLLELIMKSIIIFTKLLQVTGLPALIMSVSLKLNIP